MRPSSSTPAMALASLLVLGACVAVGRGADAHLASLLVLVAEPGLWVLLVAAAMASLRGGRPEHAALALVTLLGLASAARVSPRALPSPEVPAEATPVVRECASRAATPERPLRVATWNTGGLQDGPALARVVLSLGADLTVLQELRGEELVDEVVAALEASLADEGRSGDAATAEGLYVHAMASSGAGLFVRGGWFGVCGSEERDRWPLALPAAEGRVARATLAFPHVVGLGFLPLVAAHLDRPAGPSELTGWPERLQGSAARIGGLVQALDVPSAVVLGDFNAHGTFSRFEGALQGAGLASAPSGPTWPARLGPVPALPLYTLDRVWAGPAWVVAEVETRRTDPPSDHLAVVATLHPRRGEAGITRP